MAQKLAAQTIVLNAALRLGSYMSRGVNLVKTADMQSVGNIEYAKNV